MKNQTKNEVIEEVINEGKIPEDITSGSNSKSITKSLKITPAQNEQLAADMEACGCKKFTEYVTEKLFGCNTTVITIKEGHEILTKLAECANLLNQANTSDSVKLMEKFGDIEKLIMQIFDFIDAIKNKLLYERNDD